MIPVLSTVAEQFITVTPNYYRSLPAEEYAEKLRALGLVAQSAPSIPEGVRLAAELAGEHGAVCALGSLYFSQDVKDAILALEL